MKRALPHTWMPDSRDCLQVFHLSDIVGLVLASNDAIDILQTSSPSLELLGSLTRSCPVTGCLIVIGAATLGPVCSSAHLAARTPSLWTTGAMGGAGLSNQEWSATKPGAAGDAQDVIDVCSRRASPRLTCPVTGLKIDRPVKRYVPTCADVWSLCSLFLASSACACAQLDPRLRGRLPNSDPSQWLGLHVRTYLLFVVGLGTARYVGPLVAQPLLCPHVFPRGHCSPHSRVEQRSCCRPTRSSDA